MEYNENGKKRKRDEFDEEDRTKRENMIEFVTDLFEENKEDITLQTIVEDLEQFKENEQLLLEQPIAESSEIESLASIEQHPEQYPSKLIINITTHGEIFCKQNEDTGKYEPDMTIVPDGMKVIKFTLSGQGLISWTSIEEVNMYLAIVNFYANNILDSDFDDVDIRILIDGFRLSLDKIKREINESEKGKKKKDKDDDLTQFMMNFEKGYNVFKLNSGTKIVNKRYLRTFDEKNKNDFAITELTRQIPIPNTSSFHRDTLDELPELPDILSVLKPSTDPDSSQTISLEKLLEYYKDKGVTTLIIFDFSCSIFIERVPDPSSGEGMSISRRLNDRNVRAMRKQMCNKFICEYEWFDKMPYGGRKHTKKYKKSKKYKKYNKKTKKRKVHTKN